jgi:hypothetical protein
MKSTTSILKGIVLSFFSIILLISCEPLPGKIDLVTSPEKLIMLDSDSTRELVISTLPVGKTTFQVSHKPTWLNIEPMNGMIDNELKILNIQLNTEFLSAGIYHDSISIITGGAGKSTIPVTLSVTYRPKMLLNITELNYDLKTNKISLYIENIGSGVLEWSFEDLPVWLQISQNITKGILYPSTGQSIELNCLKEKLNPGRLNTSIRIQTNSLEIQKMEFTSKTVVFDYDSNESNIYLKNSGNSAITWNSSYPDYLQLNPSSGTINKGDSVLINLRLHDRSSLGTGSISASVTALNNHFSTSVTATVNNYINTKWHLQKIIATATFCSAINKIIAISSNPNSVLVIDPETRNIQSINLNHAPQCLSVEKTGRYAAIGHNAVISLIDLSEMSLKKEFNIATNHENICITSDNWIYHFYNYALQGINHTTGTIGAANSSMYSSGPIELHPSEKYIYGYSRGTSGSIYKFSVKEGVIKTLYYKTPSYMFWLSTSGERMYKANWDMLLLGETEIEDLAYNMNFIDLQTSVLSTLTDSKQLNKTFVISSRDYSSVRSYDYNYLNFEKSYQIESFLIKNLQTGYHLYQGEGKFLFVNEKLKRLYVLLRAHASSGLYYDWAIQTINF